MRLDLPSNDILPQRFPDDADVREAGDLPAPVLRTLAELATVVTGAITLARDFEGCLFALVEDASGPFDVLALTDDGRIGFGGVNLPTYFESVAQLIEDNAKRRRL
jgi:hypothetical protein